MEDHYELLGIADDASLNAIRDAYRNAARDSHPDRDGGSHDLMIRVNAAWATLSDPDNRAAYDAELQGLSESSLFIMGPGAVVGSEFGFNEIGWEPAGLLLRGLLDPPGRIGALQATVNPASGRWWTAELLEVSAALTEAVEAVKVRIVAEAPDDDGPFGPVSDRIKLGIGRLRRTVTITATLPDPAPRRAARALEEHAKAELAITENAGRRVSALASAASDTLQQEAVEHAALLEAKTKLNDALRADADDTPRLPRERRSILAYQIDRTLEALHAVAYPPRSFDAVLLVMMLAFGVVSFWFGLLAFVLVVSGFVKVFEELVQGALMEVGVSAALAGTPGEPSTLVQLLTAAIPGLSILGWLGMRAMRRLRRRRRLARLRWHVRGQLVALRSAGLGTSLSRHARTWRWNN